MSFHKRKLVYLIFILSMILYGCTPANEEGFKPSKNFMKDFQSALVKNNIPFRIDDTGYIRYPEEYKEEVEKAKNEVYKELISEIGAMYKDKMVTDYFRTLLDKNGISYRTDYLTDARMRGDWTYWRPESKDQEREIETKVNMYSLELEKKENSARLPCKDAKERSDK